MTDLLGFLLTFVLLILVISSLGPAPKAKQRNRKKRP
jgi:hypothetical protein